LIITIREGQYIGMFIEIFWMIRGNWTYTSIAKSQPNSIYYQLMPASIFTSIIYDLYKCVTTLQTLAPYTVDRALDH